MNESPISKAMAGTRILNSLPDEIKGLVLDCCSYLGMGPQIDSHMTATREFITMHLTKYTQEELKLAVGSFVKGDMNIKKLSTKTMSPYLIGAIMKEYDGMRGADIVRRKKIEQSKPEPRIQYGPKNYEKAYSDVVKHITDHNELPMWGLWQFIFEHFKRNKLGWFGLNKKERDEKMEAFMESTRSSLKREKMSSKSIISNIAGQALSSDEAMKRECRSRYIRQHFENIINE